MRRSIVLSLPFQLLFHGYTLSDFMLCSHAEFYYSTLLIATMLTFIILSVIMASVGTLNVCKVNAIFLCVFRLSVVAPFKGFICVL
jgi:hypothetical protein